MRDGTPNITPCTCDLRLDENGMALKPDMATCGTCGFSWCDRCHPTPGARTPCEGNHVTEYTNNQTRRRVILEDIIASDYDPRGATYYTRPTLGTIPRWVAVGVRNCGRSHSLAHFDTKGEALASLESSSGDWSPLAVIDLETGDEYEVEPRVVAVSVSRGEWASDEDDDPDD